MTITRREAVIRMAVLMGATLVGPRLFAADFANDAADNSAQGFSAPDLALLDEIGDTIIPATDVPGAKAVGIGAFIAMMVRDCYPLRDQVAFKSGLGNITSVFKARFGGDFVTGSSSDRTILLNELDREQKAFTALHPRNNFTNPDDEAVGPHYFRIMKELTILGYFTSEIGCTQGLRFVETPGRFDGASAYKEGDHAWFI